MYGPQKGFAQSQYFDQQATALAGMLANASDINLVDSAYVGEVDAITGLMAGIGVMSQQTVQDRPGINADAVIPPLSVAGDADFAGIVVRNQFMRTNSDGQACYFAQDMCNYARRGRAGARVWVRLESGSTSYHSPVYWIVRDTTGHKLPIGSFAGAAITGTATPTAGTINSGLINVNGVKALKNAGFTVRIKGTEYTIAGQDFSSVRTIADIALKLHTAFTAVTAPASVTPFGNGIVITTTDKGAVATVAYAVSPLVGVDASGALGLTEATGAILTQGAAGVATDTVLLTNAWFLSAFTAGAKSCNNIALLELL